MSKFTNEIAIKMQAAVDAQNNPRINQATVWQGDDGRVRMYWGGDHYLEYVDGVWSNGGFDRKKAERLLLAVREISG